jgi:hypothetical protein
MKTPGERGLGTRWGWVVNITARSRFTPGERTPGTHCTGGWVDPTAGLDAEARRKILCFCRESNPGRPVRSQTLYWLSYRGSLHIRHRIERFFRRHERADEWRPWIWEI